MARKGILALAGSHVSLTNSVRKAVASVWCLVDGLVNCSVVVVSSIGIVVSQDHIELWLIHVVVVVGVHNTIVAHHVAPRLHVRWSVQVWTWSSRQSSWQVTIEGGLESATHVFRSQTSQQSADGESRSSRLQNPLVFISSELETLWNNSLAEVTSEESSSEVSGTHDGSRLNQQTSVCVSDESISFLDGLTCWLEGLTQCFDGRVSGSVSHTGCSESNSSPCSRFHCFDLRG